MTATIRPAVGFVDESTRAARYLLACTIVELRHLADIRRELAALVLADRQRIHFVKESVARRRQLLPTFNALPQRTLVNVCPIGPAVTQHAARAACLAAFVRDLLAQQVERIVLESRHSMDHDDARTIAATRTPTPRLLYEHLVPAHEPLLWLPDAYAWAVGAGGDWRARAAAGVDDVRTVRP
ncbi:MAG: hypothetical protein R2755_29965 [Acidimicrobiales bacterium]